MLLSVVAPCFNEEESLENFYRRVTASISETHFSNSYEFILVDDGSKDNTWEIIQRLHRKDLRVRGFRLSRNFGHQCALSAGLIEARGDYIFILDADLQDPPELLSKMIEKMNEGFDVVYGQRKVRNGESAFKKLTALFFYRLLSLISEVEIPKDTGDFRLINRKVHLAYNGLIEGQRFTRGLIAWLGFRQTSLLYDRDPRFAGVTKYTFTKMFNFALDAMTSFSIRPFRFILLLGGLTLAMGFLGSVYLIYRVINFHAFPTWLGLSTMLLFLGGLQLICMWLIGEYVGRTFKEVKRRPLYLIQEQTDVSPSPIYGLTPVRGEGLVNVLENMSH